MQRRKAACLTRQRCRVSEAKKLFCYDVMTDLASMEKLCFQNIHHHHQHVCMYPIGLEVYCLYGIFIMYILF
jgi:hypothetical protein